MRRKRKSIDAFIDSQNLNVGVQKFGWKMDWIKFRAFLRESYNVEKAYMFIGYVPEFEDMYKQLHDAGFLIVLKPTFDMTRVRPAESEKPKDPSNKEEERKTKGNVDADLVLWAMKEMKNYHKAVIVSGDGDFYSLIEYLDHEKKLLKVLTPNAQYSGLFHKYDGYIERLDTHRRDLAYRDFKRKNNRKK